MSWELYAMHLLWPEATEPGFLAGGDVHIWAVALDAGKLDERESVLSTDERERADRFRRPDLRRRFVAARVTLRSVLGRYLGIPPASVRLDYDSGGKPMLSSEPVNVPSLRDPRLAAGDVHFNLAHSDELALIAVATGCEVGVDVERLRPVRRLDELSRRYFSAGERESVLSADEPQQVAAFLNCWTGKEAVLKAIGTGLGHPLETFDVSTAEPLGGWVDFPPRSTAGPVRCWLARLSPSEDYVGAVACVDSRRRIVGRTFGGM